MSGHTVDTIDIQDEQPIEPVGGQRDCRDSAAAVRVTPVRM